MRDSILSYLEQGNAGHYGIGRFYNHTVDNKLAEKNGYESAQQFFSQHIKTLSQRWSGSWRRSWMVSCRPFAR